MAGSYLVAGARTPIGRFQGALASLSAMDLGGVAIKEALARANVAPEEVQYVFMGQVLQAGQGQITARQAAVKGGIPMSIPSTTVNKVCLSGLNTIYLANLMITSGEADIVVAGGMESMTRAPYLLPGARGGLRMGDAQVIDSMMYDGLFCAFDQCAMGLGTDRYLAGFPAVTRARQDAIAANSHERAARAIKDGRMAREIATVSIPQRKGDPVLVDTDEGVRPGTTVDTLGNLRPAFSPDGTITAGNASQISDGASAIVMMSEREAERRGVTPMGQFVSYGQVSGPDASLLTQPSNAIRMALAKTSLSASDISLYEINEAFAAVAAASMDDLGISDEIVNVNGGAIALGHPIGASGSRLALTLLHELALRGETYGAAALCGGGGQGDALIVRRVG
ncbi:MAG: acetyl-CoA C-acetyltransferase [Actinomycetota bacterium]|nr:acetyl-CoA C-acetyltransferase [Actinomycetota bacterium]